MDKKKRVIMIVAAAVIFIAAIAVGFLIKSKDNKKAVQQQTVTDIAAESQKSISDEASMQNEKQYAQVLFSSSNSWESDGRKFIQYELNVKNTGTDLIENWNIGFPVGTDTVLEQNWNCTIESSKQDNEMTVFKLSPVDYNKIIAVGEGTQGIGFIISMSKDYMLEAYTIETTINGMAVTFSSGGQGQEQMQQTENTPSENVAEESDVLQEEGDTSDSDKNNKESNKNLQYTQSASGGLHVSGTALLDSDGNAVQLRGVSTHGLAWFPEYVNKEAFETLRDDWGANVIRLAMYTEEYGGYCSGGDKEALKQLIDDGVKYTYELGMYVIIDWHILSDANPNKNKDEAKAFFLEMSSKYAGYNHVIYELCNEPQNSDWNSQIKPYAEEVISCIRENDTDALILVGTNTWSQDIDSVIGNELDDDNVMYVLHFYAGTHKDALRNKLIAALDAGVPAFISECSICDASGNGGIDYDSAESWLKLLNDRGVSFIAWSLSNKNETSALIQPGCTKLSGWTENDLSETGKWFKSAIKD